MHRQLLSLAILAALGASMEARADQVGVTSAVAPDAHSRFGSAAPKIVRLGDHVLHNQRFQTEGKGVVQILLADGSSFTVGPNSSLVIDSFVYDPAKGTAKLAASASRGIMRFIGGAASKDRDGAKISTPVGVAGIRGAIADLQVPESPDGQLRLDLQYGELAWLSCGGGTVGSISNPGSSMLVDGDNQGCGVVSYATGLPAMNPGAVPDAPLGDLNGGAALFGDPNGLAGFSGGPANLLLGRLITTAGVPGSIPGVLPPSPVDLFQARIEELLVPPPGPPLRTLNGNYNGFLSAFSGGSTSGGNAALIFDAAAGTFGATLSPDMWSSGQYQISTSDGHYTTDTNYGGSNSYGNLQRAADQGLLCDCSFLQWGTWQANGVPVSWGTASADGGYWLTGTLTATAQLPTNISANYSGYALGTTNNAGVVTQNVRGNFWATVDFATGAGGLIISGFDGRDFGDSNLLVTRPVSGNAPAGAFSGNLQGNTASLSGRYAAAFAGNDVDLIAALLGYFTVTDGSWSGAGIFAGNRGNTPQPMPYPVPPPPPNPRTLDGTRNGFVSAFSSGYASGGSAALNFNAAAGLFDATLSPDMWSGDSYRINTSEGYYTTDTNYGGSNSYGNLQRAANQGLLCDCSFLQWGTWQANGVPVSWGTASADGGYWITGTLTATAQLPTNISANYSGYALGTTHNAGVVTQNVRGNFWATVDFATGAGGLIISGFDGRDFGDSNLLVTRPVAGNAPAGAFSGNLQGNTSSLSGRYAAAFAGNDADLIAALLGYFTVTDGSWSGAGIFAGNRGNTPQPMPYPVPPPPPNPRTLDGTRTGFISAFSSGYASGGSAALNFNAAAGLFDATLSPDMWSSDSYRINTSEGYYTTDTNYGGSNSYGNLQRAAAQGLLCDCSFLQWGTWQASGVPVSWGTASADGGYWITGTLTATAQLPTNISANYSGYALGTTHNAGVVTQNVRGNFWATVDFATGAGGLIISGFDGRDFGDSNLLVTRPVAGNAPAGAFSGNLQGNTASLSGRYAAAFAGNDADLIAALLGYFTVTDGSWSGAGIFAGNRGNTPQPMPYPEPPPPPNPVGSLDGTYNGFVSAYVQGNTSGGSAALTFDPMAPTFGATLTPDMWSGEQYQITTAEGHYNSDTDYGGSNSYGNLQRAANQGLLCDCSFLQWGTWQASGVPVSWGTASADGGYWITGTLTTTAQLPTNISANYSGQAIGTTLYGGVQTSNVQGNFWATVDFATGSGGLIISGFDGRDFGDSNLSLGNAPTGNAPGGSFTGSLQGNTASLSGSYTAAFAGNGSDVVAALLGNFNVKDGEWSGSGIFAGIRGNTPQPMPYPEPPVIPPPVVLEGAFSGFGSHRAGGATATPTAVTMNFNPAAQQFTADFKPIQWEGASYQIVTGEGQYVPGTPPPINGSNSYGAVQGGDPSQAMCQCDFLTWGSWNATNVPANGTTYSADNGYWVIGQLTPKAQLPTDITATYAGAARGTVFQSGTLVGEGRGDFSATVDFSTGLGSMQIDNFGVPVDGVVTGGKSFGTSSLDINSQAQVGDAGTAFRGSFSSTVDPYMHGEYNAAFATDGTDPAAALLGSFRVEDSASGWEAQGVFAGNKTGQMPAPTGP